MSAGLVVVSLDNFVSGVSTELVIEFLDLLESVGDVFCFLWEGVADSDCAIPSSSSIGAAALFLVAFELGVNGLSLLLVVAKSKLMASWSLFVGVNDRFFIPLVLTPRSFDRDAVVVTVVSTIDLKVSSTVVIGRSCGCLKSARARLQS